ncbi:transcription elongation factor GreAB [Oleiharenicola lentus]|uniref:transcription elongation factor GreAB n=1 Tax=Oleiharenicola lentus TaxID=2508720 RepID=UPI003F66ED0C
MNKSTILALIIEKLSAELKLLTSAALATHAEATDEENKAEDKYDTRGLEASYLAHGQSKAAEEAALALAQFQALPSRSLAAGEPISLGALVIVQNKGRSCYFVGPRAGGTEVEVDGNEILVITPQSPLGRQLMGRKQGDSFQLDLGGKRSESLIVGVN